MVNPTHLKGYSMKPTLLALAIFSILFSVSLSVGQETGKVITQGATSPSVTVKFGDSTPNVTRNSIGTTSFSKAAVKSKKTIRTLSANDDIIKMIKESPGVVLIDFYADWCPPCRAQGVILDELTATAKSKKASVIKVNIDQHARLTELFKVKSLPTLVLIKNKKIVERQTGLADRTRVVELLSR